MLETPLGNIPVYNNVLEGLEAGHRFNCGVVYLPPSAARDGVAELIRVNPDLQQDLHRHGEDVGARLARDPRDGAAERHRHLRRQQPGRRGCLEPGAHRRRAGRRQPAEALRQGSIAIFSNSGNFTTTIATYLRMAGWGTTTLISSGKDVYIHFAAPEFAFALANDARSKAAVLYVEPGGYYELDANFTKPVVACVVGRWKSKLTRAVGHAGAMAGGNDDAAGKERWFMEKFGVDGIFTPDKPVFSAKGAVVTNIAHIPAALTAVMRENGARPDFEPEGSLALKPWFGSDRGLTLPPELDCRSSRRCRRTTSRSPQLNRQIGAVFPRQTMKDASGASQMDPKTQVTSLHGVSMLDAAQYPFETNVGLALLHEPAGENDRALVNVAVARLCQPARRSGAGGRAGGARGGQRAEHRAGRGVQHRRAAAGRAARAQAGAAADRPVRGSRAAQRVGRGLRPRRRGDSMRRPGRCSSAEQPDAKAEAMLAGLRARGAQIGVRALRAEPRRSSERGRRAGRDQRDARLGPADAQADIAAHRGMPAMVAATVRHDDRRLGAGVSSTRRMRSAALPIEEMLSIAQPQRDRGASHWWAPPSPATCSCSKRSWACCCRTGRAQSRPRAPRARLPPTARRTRSGCS